MLAVRLEFVDGSKEFVDDVHVHGIRDGELLLAAGQPGAGLDADVVTKVPLDTLRSVETCEGSLHDKDDSGGDTSSFRL